MLKDKTKTNRLNRIEKLIRTNINYTALEVKNVSYKHKNHSGDDGSGETHYTIMISSTDAFSGFTKLQNHRKIMGLLKEEFCNGLHALELKLIHK